MKQRILKAVIAGTVVLLVGCASKHAPTPWPSGDKERQINTMEKRL